VSVELYLSPYDGAMKAAPIVLVPGWWLGAWAWDEVSGKLRDSGHDVTAITLPGLKSVDADRSAVSAEDHVQAIVDAVRAQPSPVVLAVHSGAGFPGYAASDRVPELIAEMVYVDTGAGVGAMDAEFAEVEKPLPTPETLAENENLDGLTEEHLRRFRERAVPQPGGVMREAIELTNEARLDVPSTVICTAYTADEYRDAIDKGYDFVAGLKEVRNVTFVELPTSHWPMWSRPDELAAILAEIAARHSS
jgi:pimeloyl-ACP methyl ester carboxylesterase